ncbi:hypothetical protein KUTeg_007260 [Tegillarca granosa]|uniref:Uncharacterized protein n=1 Tax=Tegillarca granosa TaxID=220873 RepID=A0ABQ9FCR4_TEGGR|nr:hypothetical protein KUTeg_007260 [Tegillarca granosa]
MKNMSSKILYKFTKFFVAQTFKSHTIQLQQAYTEYCIQRMPTALQTVNERQLVYVWISPQLYANYEKQRENRYKLTSENYQFQKVILEMMCLGRKIPNLKHQESGMHKIVGQDTGTCIYHVYKKFLVTVYGSPYLLSLYRGDILKQETRRRQQAEAAEKRNGRLDDKCVWRKEATNQQLKNQISNFIEYTFMLCLALLDVHMEGLTSNKTILLKIPTYQYLSLVIILLFCIHVQKCFQGETLSMKDIYNVPMLKYSIAPQYKPLKHPSNHITIQILISKSANYNPKPINLIYMY